jgi:hypothetical protein
MNGNFRLHERAKKFHQAVGGLRNIALWPRIWRLRESERGTEHLSDTAAILPFAPSAALC